ncbi:MAG: hypothetical protein R3F35_11800 [Myxococcota bacterium]
MRNRLLASFPVALLLVAVALASAATLVSAFDRTAEAEVGQAFVVERFESTCDTLRRELHALSHDVVSCSLPPECHGSPLLCPAALDPESQQEYERLRDALHAQCGLPRSLVDFAWGAGEQIDAGARCGRVHDGFEAAARGEARPSSYLF